jgi:hypothetical protein
MDCRTFHRKLEDYLEESLDFPARFGMERHANQCYSCQKDVNVALSLRQLARDMKRVSAAQDFEAALLVRIQKEKSQRRLFSFRDWWLFGLEGFSWRVAGATAVVTMLVVGTVGYIHFGGRTDPASAPMASMESQTNPSPERTMDGAPVSVADLMEIAGGRMGRVNRLAQDSWAVPYAEPGDSDYVEFMVPVAGDRQLILQVPRTIRMRYQQPTREYFIRNVSH